MRGLVRLAFTGLNRVVPKRTDRVLIYAVPPLDDNAVGLLRGLDGGRWCNTLVVDGEPASVLARARELGAADVMARLDRRTLWRFLRARYVFMTHDLYGIAAGPRQVVVNLWHGDLTKEVGRWTGDAGVKSTYVTTLSKLGAAYRCAEFGVHPAQVLIVGSPRNDVMLRAEVADVRRRLEIAPHTRIVVWLPTRRRPEHAQQSVLERLMPADRAFDDCLDRLDALVLFKAHPQTPAAEIGVAGRRWVITDDWLRGRNVSLYELLAASDGLITDTSSVWVDYLLLDRPIWIHFPEWHAKSKWRLALEPFTAWAPGPVTTDLAALAEQLDRSFAGDDEMRAHRAFLKTVLHRHHDDGATERLLDAVGLSAPAPTVPST